MKVARRTPDAPPRPVCGPWTGAHDGLRRRRANGRQPAASRFRCPHRLKPTPQQQSATLAASMPCRGNAAVDLAAKPQPFGCVAVGTHRTARRAAAFSLRVPFRQKAVSGRRSLLSSLGKIGKLVENVFLGRIRIYNLLLLLIFEHTERQTA